MKEKELRKCATCAMCGRKIGAATLPIFRRVRIECHGINLDAVKRQMGLAMLMGGNGGLAAAMGPDEEMTMPLMEPATITVCHDCDMVAIPVARLAELAAGSATTRAGGEGTEGTNGKAERGVT